MCELTIRLPCHGMSRLKAIASSAVLVLGAATGGWVASALLSVPISSIELAAMRPCADDACGTVHWIDEEGNLIDTGVPTCYDPEEDTGVHCDMEGSACLEKECCPWWKFWC